MITEITKPTKVYHKKTLLDYNLSPTKNKDLVVLSSNDGMVPGNSQIIDLETANNIFTLEKPDIWEKQKTQLS